MAPSPTQGMRQRGGGVKWARLRQRTVEIKRSDGSEEGQVSYKSLINLRYD